LNNNPLKKAGLKTTLPRLKIIEALESSDHGHMSAEEIYRSLRGDGSDIGLATIYRVLTQLENAQIIRRQHFGNGQAKFEIETGDHHDHLICVRCGKVVEFHDQKIEASQNQVANEFGFTIKDHQMVLYGICDDEKCKVI